MNGVSVSEDTPSHGGLGDTATLTPPLRFKRKHEAPVARAILDLRPTNRPKPSAASGPAQRMGLYYERKVEDYLEKQFKRIVFQPTLWFESTTGRSARIIPDALVFSADFYYCVIVEFKYQHNADGFYQLQYYRPVVEKALPWMRVSLLEVTGAFHSVKLPLFESHVLGAEQVWNLGVGYHNVWLLTNRFLKQELGRTHGNARRSAKAAFRATG